jgi:hypothetical protein
MRKPIFLAVITVCLLTLGWIPAHQVTTSSQGVGDGEASSELCSTCGTCGGCTEADVACEDFVTEIGCVDWVDDNDASGTINHAATPDGTWPSCTNKVLDVLFGSSTGDVFAYIDLGAQPIDTDWYVSFDFKFLDDGASVAFNSEEVMSFDDQTDPYLSAAYITIYNTGDEAWEFRFKAYGDDSNEIDNDVSITAGTVYRITARVKQVTGADNDEVEWYVDGVTQNSGGAIGEDLYSTGRYLVFGSTSVVSSSYGMHFQVGNIQVDDDTLPTGCP